LTGVVSALNEVRKRISGKRKQDVPMKRPIESQTTATSPSHTSDRASLPGQVVLVLQGGGALGSYQAGVY